jgi:hypothetical protein
MNNEAEMKKRLAMVNDHANLDACPKKICGKENIAEMRRKIPPIENIAHKRRRCG